MKNNITGFYDKETENSLSIDLYFLENTGSWDERQNLICIVSAPKDIAYDLRSAYRGENPKVVKDFELVKTDNRTEDNQTVCELYFGSSYGAGSLLSAVGELIYKVRDVGAEFENQY